MIRQAFPTRAIALILAIGLIDLVTTAWLHANGLIVEMNPLMRCVIDRSEWLFILIKGMTLVAGWLMLARYAKSNVKFVRVACLCGSLAYLSIWLIWFMRGSG